MFLLPRSFQPACTQHHTASTCNRQQQSQATKLAKSVSNSLHNTANCKNQQNTSESLTSSYFALSLLTQWNTSVSLTQSLSHNAPSPFKSRKCQCITCNKLLWHHLCSNQQNTSVSSYFGTVSVQINNTPLRHLHQATLALTLFKSTTHHCITCSKLLCHYLCSSVWNEFCLPPKHTCKLVIGSHSCQTKKWCYTAALIVVT